jgi:hypothetical protein
MRTEVPPPAPVPKGRSLTHRAWRGTKRLLLYSLLLVVGAAALYLFAAYKFTYSSGERAGYVQKFSKKGWLCKTWEGELAMATMPGVMPETFAFTLHDDNVAAEINKSMGQRVALTYEQKVGLPSCFGDTPYWVTRVRPIEAAK